MKEQEELYYRRVYIRSEEDLPEENGYYYTHPKYSGKYYIESTIYEKDDNHYWLRTIDWYFLPVEQSPKDNQKTKPVAYEYRDLSGHCYVDYVRRPDIEMPDGEYTATPLYYAPTLSQQNEPIPKTCDGCVMFQGVCMLDDSCPECIERSQYTSKEQMDKRINNAITELAHYYDITCSDIEITIKNYINGKQPTTDFKTPEEILDKWEKESIDRIMDRYEYNDRVIYPAMREYASQFSKLPKCYYILQKVT